MNRNRFRTVIFKKSLFTLFLFSLYYVGRCIPLLGAQGFYNLYIDNSLIQFTGISTDNSILALGIGPWMMASVLLYVANLGKSSKTIGSTKENETFTLFLTCIFAVILAFFLVNTMNIDFMFKLANFAILVICALVVTFLGKINKKHGFSGPTIFVFAGIVVNSAEQVLGDLANVESGQIIYYAIAHIAFVIVLVAVVLVFDMAEIRIHINKAVVDSKYMPFSYLPVKLNCVGFMPIMFCGTFYAIAQLLLAIIQNAFNLEDNYIVASLTNANSPLGIVLYLLIMFVLSIVLSKFILDPEKLGKDLQKNNEYIDGYTPGKQTINYLVRLVKITSIVNAVILVIIIGGPSLIGICLNIGWLTCVRISSQLFLIYILKNIIDEYFYERKVLLFGTK